MIRCWLFVLSLAISLARLLSISSSLAKDTHTHTLFAFLETFRKRLSLRSFICWFPFEIEKPSRIWDSISSCAYIELYLRKEKRMRFEIWSKNIDKRNNNSSGSGISISIIITSPKYNQTSSKIDEFTALRHTPCCINVHIFYIAIAWMLRLLCLFSSSSSSMLLLTLFCFQSVSSSPFFFSICVKITESTHRCVLFLN